MKGVEKTFTEIKPTDNEQQSKNSEVKPLNIQIQGEQTKTELEKITTPKEKHEEPVKSDQALSKTEVKLVRKKWGFFTQSPPSKKGGGLYSSPSKETEFFNKEKEAPEKLNPVRNFRETSQSLQELIKTTTPSEKQEDVTSDRIKLKQSESKEETPKLVKITTNRPEEKRQKFMEEIEKWASEHEK